MHTTQGAQAWKAWLLPSPDQECKRVEQLQGTPAEMR